MILCRVKGNVVASAKHPSFRGHKVLIVQPIDEGCNDMGDSFLAQDPVEACPGDTVLVAREGNCARQILGKPEDPFHSVIIGVVDRFSVEE